MFVGKAGGGEFFVDLVETDLVEFVDGHGDVDNLIGRTDHFGNAGEDLRLLILMATRMPKRVKTSSTICMSSTSLRSESEPTTSASHW